MDWFVLWSRYWSRLSVMSGDICRWHQVVTTKPTGRNRQPVRRPNRRAISRTLMPSQCAKRIRAYSSTSNILAPRSDFAEAKPHWCRSPPYLQFRSSGGSQWLRPRSDGAARSGSARGLFSRRGDGYTLLPGERFSRTVWIGTGDCIAGLLADRRSRWMVSSAMLTRLVAGGGNGSCEAYRRTPRAERGRGVRRARPPRPASPSNASIMASRAIRTDDGWRRAG